MAEKNQKLVVAILEFLEESTVDGSVLENDKKRIEAASKPFLLLIMPQHTSARSEAPSMAIVDCQGPTPRTPSQQFSVCSHTFPQFNALARPLGSALPTKCKDRS